MLRQFFLLKTVATSINSLSWDVYEKKSQHSIQIQTQHFMNKNIRQGCLSVKSHFFSNVLLNLSNLFMEIAYFQQCVNANLNQPIPAAWWMQACRRL